MAIQAAKGEIGFKVVRVPFSEWANPADASHEGERVLWPDGTARGFPEDRSEYVNVLRRIEGQA